MFMSYDFFLWALSLSPVGFERELVLERDDTHTLFTCHVSTSGHLLFRLAFLSFFFLEPSSFRIL